MPVHEQDLGVGRRFLEWLETPPERQLVCRWQRSVPLGKGGCLGVGAAGPTLALIFKEGSLASCMTVRGVMGWGEVGGREGGKATVLS